MIRNVAPSYLLQVVDGAFNTQIIASLEKLFWIWVGATMAVGN